MSDRSNGPTYAVTVDSSAEGFHAVVTRDGQAVYRGGPRRGAEHRARTRAYLSSWLQRSGVSFAGTMTPGIRMSLNGYTRLYPE